MTRPQVNLYDARLRRRREWLTLPTVVAGTAAAAVAIAAAGWFVRQDLPELRRQVKTAGQRVESLQRERETLQAKAEHLRPDAQLAHKLEETRRLVDQLARIRAQIEARLDADGLPPTAILQALARAHSDRVWLTGIEYAPDRGHLAIRGRTLDPAALPAYIARLESEPVFQGRRFAAFELSAGRTAGEAMQKVSETAGQASEKAPWHEFALLPKAPDALAPAVGK